MTVKSKASKPNTSGVTLNTSGDQFAISLKIGTPGVVDPAKQVIFGTVDTTLPVVSAAQAFTYQENQASGYVIGTVLASDNSGSVTGFKFADSGTSTSQDGYYSISASGVVSLTAAGVAAAANDFETTPNSFTYGIQARDAANNWSSSADITFNVSNDSADDGGSGGGGGGGGGLQPDHITNLTWELSQSYLAFSNNGSFLSLDLDVGGQPKDGLIDILRFDATYTQTSMNQAPSSLDFSIVINGTTTALTKNVDYVLGPSGVWIELYLADHQLIDTGDTIKLIGSYGGASAETTELVVG